MSESGDKISSRREIEDLVKARYPLIYVVSHEESRVEESLKKLCIEREMRLEVWSITEGMQVLANGSGTRDVKDPLKALEHVNRGEGRALYILRDFHPFTKDPTVVRRLRDLSFALRRTKKSVILLSPVQKVPPELEKAVSAIVYWELPTRTEIDAIARRLVPQAPAPVQKQASERPEFLEHVVEAALGLTEVEAENVFAKSMVRTHTFDIKTILDEKKQIIRKSGLLEYYERTESIADVGGLVTLKDWVKKRRHAFSKKAREFGLPLPKGMLLIGVPGTGKSLTAKAVGSLWEMPLLRLDVGKIFAGLVGSSEENIRKVTQTAEAIAPAILWIDEIEKGFSGTGSSGQTDGGTTSRVFGSFITWMQEKESPVFVIATANDVSQLPPELLRKGRFDEIFFCDLPTREERRQIFEVHIHKKGRNPAEFELERLADATQEFSGAEIEQAIVQAMYDAFDSGVDITTEGLLHSLADIVPLSVTMREKIDVMREWARTRARPASGKASQSKGTWLERHGASMEGGDERKLEL